MSLVIGSPKRGESEEFDDYRDRRRTERSIVDRYLMGRKLFKCRKCGQYHKTGEICKIMPTLKRR